jgi:hypothetical protein
VSAVRLDTGGQQFAAGMWSNVQMRVPATVEGRVAQLELAVWIGHGNERGEPIPIA